MLIKLMDLVGRVGAKVDPGGLIEQTNVDDLIKLAHSIIGW